MQVITLASDLETLVLHREQVLVQLLSGSEPSDLQVRGFIWLRERVGMKRDSGCFYSSDTPLKGLPFIMTMI